MSDRTATVAAIGKSQGIEIMPDWNGLDAVMPLLEKMRSERAVVILKFDGERVGDEDNGPYTAMVQGGLLGDYFPRTDSHSIEEAVSYIIIEYAKNCWRGSV